MEQIGSSLLWFVCCCSVNVWATLNVSQEIYNSATQGDRTHTQTTKPQHGGTHTDLRLNPHKALDIYPSHPVRRRSQTTAGAPGCSVTFLHYLLGPILRPVLGTNIQLYFLGSHISLFSWLNTSVFVFRTGGASFRWAFLAIWPIFNDF